MKTYSVGALRKAILESTNEFKPVVGNKVVSDDKKNNEKAYNDIKKETKASETELGNLSQAENTYKDNFNRGMYDLSYNPDTIDDKFKKRVNSQLNGFTSEEDEKKHKNDVYGNATFGIDSKPIKQRAKENEKDWETAQQSGLAARTHKDDFSSGKNGKTVFDENRKLKRLHFKRTTFLTENHMISKIPEEFKKNGSSFIMEDSKENKYWINWDEDKANIYKHENKGKLNEEINKIKKLFNMNNDVKQQSSKDGKVNENLMLNQLIEKKIKK